MKIKIILLFVLLLFMDCATTYQKSIIEQIDCMEKLEFMAQEYIEIDSLLKSKGVHIEKADSVFQKYKSIIQNYFSNNTNIFNKNDTIGFSIKYQTQKRIAFTVVEIIDSTEKENFLKELNNSLFPDRAEIDTTFPYCIIISGNIIINLNQVNFKYINYDIGTTNLKGRTKASIMRSIMTILSRMRYAYNKSLKEKPGIKGRITIRFTINQGGKVIYARIDNSTIAYCEMGKRELDIIKNTDFGKIEAMYDLTTVVYPFVFSFN